MRNNNIFKDILNHIDKDQYTEHCKTLMEETEEGTLNRKLECVHG